MEGSEKRTAESFYRLAASEQDVIVQPLYQAEAAHVAFLWEVLMAARKRLDVAKIGAHLKQGADS